MSCTSPLEFWLTADGKSAHYGAHTEPFYVANKYFCRKVVVPCGHCIDCRQKYAYDWTARLLFEQQKSDTAFFVTLTYDDLNVPFNSNFDLTLRKSDWQKFMKRLRKQYPDNHIKYFAVGEYGSMTKRPHYHAIIFNLPLDDLLPCGLKMFSSKKLESIWQKGRCTVQDVNSTTCRYVCGYMLKDTRPKSEFKRIGIEPPFTLISKKPSIGIDYYLENKDRLKDGGLIYCPDGSLRTSLACYDRYLERDYGKDCLLKLKTFRRDTADLYSDGIPVFDKRDEYLLKNAVKKRQQKKGAF